MVELQKISLERCILPGLTFGTELVSAAEEYALVAASEQVDLPLFRLRGTLQKRRTASFGWRYDFDSESLQPAEKLPAFLLALRQRASWFAGMTADMLEHTVLTRYDPGAGIPWHRDKPAFDQVVGVSFGAPSVLRFRRRTAAGFETADLPLPPRSVYCLTGEVRDLWEHRIPKVTATRWSVTFRSLRAGRRLLNADADKFSAAL